MKPKAKKFLSNFFLGLFSNDQAIEGSKSNPWWVGLIIALFAVLLPVIPITVAQSRTYGASFLSKYTYRFDQNIADATVKLAKDNKEFKVENKILNYYADESIQSNFEGLVYSHTNTSTKQYELMIYYTTKTSKEYSTYVNGLIGATYKIGTTDTPEDGYEGSTYSPSLMVLASTHIYTRLVQEDSTTASTSGYTNYTTDWKHFAEGTELIKGALPDNKTADQVDLNNSNDVNAIFKNWKSYYNKAYLTQKNINVWGTSGIFLGIYVALVFIMGLLVFLLTRGKNNMFNYLTFIDTQKIVWWASLSPAILALILGFIISNFAQMIFIILLGLRVMWISMRQLRPQY